MRESLCGDAGNPRVFSHTSDPHALAKYSNSKHSRMANPSARCGVRVALVPRRAPAAAGGASDPTSETQGRLEKEEDRAMAELQQERKEMGGVKELVVLVGILLTVIAGAIGTYWIHSQGVEAAPGGSTGPRAVIPAPPAGVFHADVYFDFKSTRLRADAASVLQETAGRMDLGNAWVVMVQGYTDSHGPIEYNRGLAERRAQVVKRFLMDLGVPEASIKVVTMGRDGALCDDPGKECQELNRRVHLEFRKLAAAATTPAPGAGSAAERPQSAPASPAGDR
jgi:outer membrane protein OmpA-like peptidoglycan-associated protein